MPCWPEDDGDDDDGGYDDDDYDDEGEEEERTSMAMKRIGYKWLVVDLFPPFSPHKSRWMKNLFSIQMLKYATKMPIITWGRLA